MAGRLWLVTTGGLCNRLQVLLSGRRWADDAGRSFRCAWPVNDRFGARFEDLFDDDYPRVPFLAARVAGRVVGNRHTSGLVDPDAERSRLLVVRDGRMFRGRDGKPYDIRASLAALRPTPAVEERIRAVPLGSGPVVGVFIRAHADAHEETTTHSPPEWFYGRMADIRAEYPAVEFFLSTDVPEVSAEVHRRFDRVHEQSDKGPHNSVDALVASVADLYLLAGTRYLLGSHYSSFSRTAARMSAHGALETARRPAAVPLSECLGDARPDAP